MKILRKKVAEGYPLCKSHVAQLQKAIATAEEEFVAPARAPKYIDSNILLSDDKLRYRSVAKTIIPTRQWRI